MGKLVVGITGASGAIYAQRFIVRAVAAYERVFVVMSEQAQQVAMTELDLDLRGWLSGLHNVELLDPKNYYTPPASGSFVHDGMVVVPCSMGTAGRIANGISDDLLTRCADVCLKERRKLVVVPREMPWNLIMLRNLASLAEAGAIVLPACPAWYHRPRTLEDLADTVVARIFQALGIQQEIVKAWMEE